MYSRFFVLFLILLIGSSCSNQEKVVNAFQQLQEQVGQQFAPDKSLAVFKFELKNEDGQWILRGETSIPEAHAVLWQKVDSLLKGQVVDSSVVLPAQSLGDSTWAIVTVSVANLRRSPRHAAELVDQSIMGQVLKLLKRQGSWFLVQTPYKYLGWMTKYSFVRTNRVGVDEWTRAKRVRVKTQISRVFTRPDRSSIPLYDVVMNSTLKVLSVRGKWTEVGRPDGRQGFILSSDVGPLQPKGVSREAIVKTAFSLQGIPYLWGGNSTKGSDCSGFTQTVFSKNGIQLPRDARQQALIGKTIVPEKDFSNVLPGDLLFFGPNENRITHVGISLGGYKFIHQDREVRVNSFNPEDEDFNPYRLRTLRKIKRILK